MGGIDEAALDRLSLVTQMTKHIRVRASGGRTTPSEIGQFSPIFVWLLRVICFRVFYWLVLMFRYILKSFVIMSLFYICQNVYKWSSFCS